MSTSAELEAAGPSGRQETANGNPSDQPAEMAMEVAEQPGTSMRVLALYCTSSAVPEQDQGFDPPDACNINHLAARPGIEVGSRLNVAQEQQPRMFATASCTKAAVFPDPSRLLVHLLPVSTD